jgi:hypothetical protein
MRAGISRHRHVRSAEEAIRLRIIPILIVALFNRCAGVRLLRDRPALRHR